MIIIINEVIKWKRKIYFAGGKVLSKVNNKYSDSLSKISVTLEIGPEMAFRAYEELSNIVVTDKGTLLCNIEVSDMNWFTSYVLSYGSHIQVLEPIELKEKVMHEIEKMKHLYSD